MITVGAMGAIIPFSVVNDALYLLYVNGIIMALKFNLNSRFVIPDLLQLLEIRVHRNSFSPEHPVPHAPHELCQSALHPDCRVARTCANSN